MREIIGIVLISLALTALEAVFITAFVLRLVLSIVMRREKMDNDLISRQAAIDALQGRK